MKTTWIVWDVDENYQVAGPFDTSDEADDWLGNDPEAASVNGEVLERRE